MLLREFLLSMDITCDCTNIDFEPLDMFAGEFIGQCSPLFSWVGGKTQLLSALRFYSPQKFETYYEPFVGAGSLLFSLMPQKAVISDANRVITNLYNDVKLNYSSLLSVLNSLSALPDTESVFLTVRDIFNNYLTAGNYSVDLSAMFLYLNAKAFNRLYRVNSKGEFNVGYAKDSTRPNIYNPETLKYTHDYFVNNQVDILSGDFIKCTQGANKGDFVYFDPPYASVSATKNFTGYSSTGFDDSDQIRLANEFKRLSSLGVKCLLSNSDCPLIRELYSAFNIKTLNVNYYIQPTSSDIKRTECLVLNY